MPDYNLGYSDLTQTPPQPKQTGLNSQSLFWETTGYVYSPPAGAWALSRLEAYIGNALYFFGAQYNIGIYIGTEKVVAGTSPVVILSDTPSWIPITDLTWFNGHTELVGGNTYLIVLWSDLSAMDLMYLEPGGGGVFPSRNIDTQAGLTDPLPSAGLNNETAYNIAMRAVFTGTGGAADFMPVFQRLL